METAIHEYDPALFSKRIKYILAGGSMTQSELAEKAGISKATLSAYLNPPTGETPGKKAVTPSLSIAMKLAECLQVSMDWLLGREAFAPSGGESRLQTCADAVRMLEQLLATGVLRTDAKELKPYFSILNKPVSDFYFGDLLVADLGASTPGFVPEIYDAWKAGAIAKLENRPLDFDV